MQIHKKYIKKKFYTLPMFSSKKIKQEYLPSVLWRVVFISKETCVSICQEQIEFRHTQIIP